MFRMLGAAVAALALTLAGSAAAATIEITYIGKVRYGYDSAGIFGPGSSDLTGEAFKAFILIDDTKGVSSYDLPTSSRIFGYEAESPLSGVVTIRGVDYVLNGAFYGEASQTISPTENIIYHQINSYYDPDWANAAFLQAFMASSEQFLSTADYHFPVARYAYGGDAGGTFSVRADSESAVDLVFDVGLVLVGGQPIPSAVPEPSTWALLIAGFGLVGGALRTRRRAHLA